MKFYLIVAKGKHQGLPIPIKIDLFVLGSDKVCQLSSKLPGIATRHCALVTREKKVFIRDFDGGEPTLVNGELVPPGEEWPLHKGDRIVVGPLEFIIQMQERPLSGRDLEEWALKCLDDDSERESREGDDPDEIDARQVTQRFLDASQAAATMLDRLQDMRGVVQGRLRVSHLEGVTILHFNDVNLVEESEIALIKKEIHDHVNRRHLRVLLDFKNVQRMSSSAVEMILELYRWLRSHDSKLAVCRLRSEFLGILEILKEVQPVPNFKDKKEALAARW
jgi:anti-anti-sigma regulatory factor